MMPPSRGKPRTTSPRASVRVLALLALGLAGCSQFDVKARQDPAADFTRLRTYAWLPPEEAEPADQRVNDRGIDRRIRAATERQLREKGYRPADSGTPDFLLNYRLSTSPADAVGGRGRGYVGNTWGGWAGVEPVYESYDAGTLYLAALNGETKRMIWLGAAQARLLPHVSYEKRVKRVDAAVRKILAPFPKR
jgi:hypothetical protein